MLYGKAFSTALTLSNGCPRSGHTAATLNPACERATANLAALGHLPVSVKRTLGPMTVLHLGKSAQLPGVEKHCAGMLFDYRLPKVLAGGVLWSFTFRTLEPLALPSK